VPLQVLQAKAPPPVAGSGPPSCLQDLLTSPTARALPVALVLKTGFSTARGQLVRAILYPKPPKFDFEAQGYRCATRLWRSSSVAARMPDP
jgi:hypothetical protein